LELSSRDKQAVMVRATAAEASLSCLRRAAQSYIFALSSLGYSVHDDDDDDDVLFENPMKVEACVEVASVCWCLVTSGRPSIPASTMKDPSNDMNTTSADPQDLRIEATAAKGLTLVSEAGKGVWVTQEVAQEWAQKHSSKVHEGTNGERESYVFPESLQRQHAASLAAATSAADEKVKALEQEVAAVTENFNVYRSRAHK